MWCPFHQFERTQPFGTIDCRVRLRLPERLNPFVDRRELARLRRLGYACANGIEIDIRQAGHEGRFIETFLALEPSFPESAGAPVFFIRFQVSQIKVPPPARARSIREQYQPRFPKGPAVFGWHRSRLVERPRSRRRIRRRWQRRQRGDIPAGERDRYLADFDSAGVGASTT